MQKYLRIQVWLANEMRDLININCGSCETGWEYANRSETSIPLALEKVSARKISIRGQQITTDAYLDISKIKKMAYVFAVLEMIRCSSGQLSNFGTSIW